MYGVLAFFSKIFHTAVLNTHWSEISHLVLRGGPHLTCKYRNIGMEKPAGVGKRVVYALENH